MKKSILKPLGFAAALLPIGAVGGAFVGIYTFAAYSPQLQSEILAQMGSYNTLLLLTAVQTMFLAAVFGFFGYILAEKIGLMRSFRLEKAKLTKTLVITAISGVLFSLDYWTFGRWIPQLAALFDELVTPANFIASVLYGGVIEEVLLRLFVMSLIAFLIWKLFYRKAAKADIPQRAFVTANILAALLFAAGHLPATISLFGQLTPLIVFRCFLLNGGLGIVFGHLYRRFGIQYAMIAHGGCHIISKLIWLLLI